MADYYMSVTSDYDTFSKDPDNRGSSSTAADKVEFRFDTTLTQRQAINCLRRFERWLEQNGLNGLGASIPPNRG